MNREGEVLIIDLVFYSDACVFCATDAVLAVHLV